MAESEVGVDGIEPKSKVAAVGSSTSVDDEFSSFGAIDTEGSSEAGLVGISDAFGGLVDTVDEPVPTTMASMDLLAMGGGNRKVEDMAADVIEWEGEAVTEPVAAADENGECYVYCTHPAVKTNQNKPLNNVGSFCIVVQNRTHNYICFISPQIH